METNHPRRAGLAMLSVAPLTLTAGGTGAVGAAVAAAASRSPGPPIVSIDGGAMRGVAKPGAYPFRGLPSAAAPTAAWGGGADG
jgi:hypothetical protein